MCDKVFSNWGEYDAPPRQASTTMVHTDPDLANSTGSDDLPW